MPTHVIETDDPEFWPCPEGCGSATDDPCGGPCTACWNAIIDRERSGRGSS
jgi:hypothetical protein